MREHQLRCEAARGAAQGWSRPMEHFGWEDIPKIIIPTPLQWAGTTPAGQCNPTARTGVLKLPSCLATPFLGCSATFPLYLKLPLHSLPAEGELTALQLLSLHSPSMIHQFLLFPAQQCWGGWGMPPVSHSPPRAAVAPSQLQQEPAGAWQSERTPVSSTSQKKTLWLFSCMQAAEGISHLSAVVCPVISLSHQPGALCWSKP